MSMHIFQWVMSHIYIQWVMSHIYIQWVMSHIYIQWVMSHIYIQWVMSHIWMPILTESCHISAMSMPFNLSACSSEYDWELIMSASSSLLRMTAFWKVSCTVVVYHVLTSELTFQNFWKVFSESVPGGTDSEKKKSDKSVVQWFGMMYWVAIWLLRIYTRWDWRANSLSSWKRDVCELCVCVCVIYLPPYTLCVCVCDIYLPPYTL